MKTRSQRPTVESEDEEEEEEEEVPKKQPGSNKERWGAKTAAPLSQQKRVEFVSPPVATNERFKSRMAPYVDVPRMDPALKQRWEDRQKDRREEPIPDTEKRGPAYKHKAPIEEEADIEGLMETLREQKITVTQAQLLAIMDAQHRKRIVEKLTAKRIPTQPREPVQRVLLLGEDKEPMYDSENRPYEVLLQEELPELEFRILQQEEEGMPEGSIVMVDPVVQYLNDLEPDDAARKVVVARESYNLKALYPLINGNATIESLLDGGSQIISMSKESAMRTSIAWDPNTVINMQSANKQVEPTQGLARNVPFNFGDITLYLQVHVMTNPAYDVLLGRPFEVLTRMNVQNETDGSQTVTITDPNTQQKSTMPSYDRGRPPRLVQKKKPELDDSF
ncbi:hypothetical protein BJ912DRAFT_1064603 [Pholiota molesta]|nr:hypothetical protein BJ912DRAFT_1064603 [Pholiota molesta]